MKKLITLFILIFFAALSVLQAQSYQTLYGWGYNDKGQVGDGVLFKLEPYPTGDPDFKWLQLSTGEDHSLAIKADGTLWVWGDFDGASPVQIGRATDWASVHAGRDHSLALKEDGTLWAWGSNSHGELGDGTNTYRYDPVQIGAAAEWASVTTKNNHTLAIKKNGTLWAWGSNANGQLGNGSQTNANVPVQVGTAANWASVTAGSEYALAIKTDGTLWAWGANRTGQLGVGTYEGPVTTPVQIGVATDWAAVTAGEGQSLALKNNGTLWAWGNNYYGQLGGGTELYRSAPVQLGTATNWAKVTAGYHHTLALKTDGTLWAWGRNAEGQLGDGTLTQRNFPVQIGTTTAWAAVAAGLDYSIAINSEGMLMAWGNNNKGQLGDGENFIRYTPVKLGSATDWAAVAAGTDHSMAVKHNGTLWIWGYNRYGQLGDGTTIKRSAPVQIGTATDWKSVHPGRDHSLAIKTNGTLWAWGRNYHGQLGDGTTTDRTTPVKIGTATDWASVVTVGNFNLALKTNGTLWAWGNNEKGQLGDGTTIGKTIPVQIGTATDWAAVAAGGSFSIAIKKDGTLWAWGSNASGRLGDGTTTDKTTPIQIGTATDWVSVATGVSHTIAIKENGTLWAWGFNYHGALGDGTTTDKTTPVQIGTATDWVSVAAGRYHSLAIKNNGTLWAWGQNYAGQLGDGSRKHIQLIPLQIGTATDWSLVSAGGYHSLAISSDNDTDLPVLNKPQQNGFSGRNIEVEFVLPEAAKPGSVRLTFTRSGGEADPYAPHTITLAEGFETAAKHGHTLDGSDLSSSTAVVGVSTGTNDALVSGAVYTVSIAYQDHYNHAEAKFEITGFTFDSTSPVIFSKAATIQLNGEGAATLFIADIEAGSSDNITTQQNLIFSLSKVDFSCTDAGVNEVTFTVTDQAGNSSSSVVEVTIEDIIAPAIEADQLFVIDENTSSGTVVGMVVATDNCSVQRYSISAGNTADAFAIDGEGSVSVHNSSALDYETQQEFILTITVADGAGNIFSETVIIWLNDVNDAPVLENVQDMTADELSLLRFTVTATDDDHAVSELQFSLDEHAPEGALLDAATGVFSWTPTEAQGPASYTFNIMVTDGELTDKQEMTVTVDEVNQAPIITSTLITIAKIGEVYVYKLTATDADFPANTLTYEALELPSWLSFDMATQELRGNPDGNLKEEAFSVRLQVSDGVESVLQEFTIQWEVLTGLFDKAPGSANILVYPNPTTGRIVIELEKPLWGEEIAVSLFDASGRMLWENTGSLEQNNEKASAYLQEARGGVYLLQIKGCDQLSSMRIIKK